MFGFLRPKCPSDAYRRCYARCCSFTHRCYGVTTTAWLSYEAVFLYCLGQDAGWVRPLDSRQPRCCRLRASRRLDTGEDALLGQFCASFGLLLAQLKLQDDVRDEGSWIAAAMARIYRRQFELAGEFFHQCDGSFRSDVGDCLEAHERLEASLKRPSLREFSQPTANGFGRVFQLLAHVFEPTRERPLTQMGMEIGKAIISFDCAVDWEHDQRFGHCNPLAQSERHAAVLRAQCHLAQAGWQCRELFGPTALSALALRGVIDRLDVKAKTLLAKPSPPGRLANALPAANSLLDVSLGEPDPAKRRARPAMAWPWRPSADPWAAGGWRARVPVRRGDCDCGGCDCGGCDSGGCDGGGCDGLSGGGEAYDGGCLPVVCCPCDACCWDPQCHRGEKNVAADSPPPTTVVGMQGKTLGPLNPMGMVRVGSKNLPAKSEGGWIEGDRPIVVIQEDDFGVVVRVLDDPALGTAGDANEPR